MVNRQNVALRCLFILLPLFALTFFGIGCGPTTSCLASGTIIETPAGDRRIETIQVGDIIYSVDPGRGRRVEARVLAVRTATRNCLRVTTASGREIVATPDHPFYCPRTGRYLPLAELLEHEDPALGLASGAGSVSPDRVLTHGDALGARSVYDLTVDHRLHNFIAAGFLVHNKSPGTPITRRPIQDLLTVSNEADGAAATLMGVEAPAPQLDATAPATLLRGEPFAGGSAVLHVTRSAPFDQIRITASLSPNDGGLFEEGEGAWLVMLPAPQTSADLRVVPVAGLPSGYLDLLIETLAGGLAGPGEAEISVPTNSSTPESSIRPIEELLTVSNDADGTAAAISPDGNVPQDASAPLEVVTRGPFTGGTGLVHVTRSAPFEEIRISANGGMRTWLLSFISSPQTSVDLRIVLEPGVAALDLTIHAIFAGTTGSLSGGSISIPADG